ncbi:unnamed protein product [Vitrella brassicaformis CCMP3155]|uniref:Rab proteins geranylgeranyltransferase component n=2 Tax=Vitrella brassicaformis TaxID=1169539 RepID=A0A0G4EJF9_VITBC|nr:unnamed protein product [Vitrella brassicaformis CCMP3155]|eukprot:CEL97118.1 unnamed protein product [Vitrella brassicaformis CCMP3155]
MASEGFIDTLSTLESWHFACEGDQSPRFLALVRRRNLSRMLLDEGEREFDVCVVGTGLIECLIAASLSRCGLKVLHLDGRDYYGGNWSSLNYKQLKLWSQGREQPEPPTDQQLQADGQTAPPPGEEWVPLDDVGSDSGVTSSCFVDRFMATEPFLLDESEPASAASASASGGGGGGGGGCETTEERLVRQSNQFCVDVCPRLLYCRSDLVDILLRSGVSRYLEFKGMEGLFTWSDGDWFRLPFSRSDIFQSSALSLIEKRLLMKFLTSLTAAQSSAAFHTPKALQGRDLPTASTAAAAAASDTDNEAEDSGDGGDESGVLDGTWFEYMGSHQLTDRLQSLMTYGVCMGEERHPQWTARQGVDRVERIIRSLGIYAAGSPFLYPMYGTAELPQAFTRVCALHRGLYMLRCRPTHIIARQGDNEKNRLVGLRLDNGQTIQASRLISSPDYIPPPQTTPAPSPIPSVLHLIALTDRALLADPSPRERPSEARTRPSPVPSDTETTASETNGGGKVGVGAGAVLEDGMTNPVQLLQVDHTTGCCPRGLFLTHLCQRAPTTLPDAAAASAAECTRVDGASPAFDELVRVLQRLLEARGGAQSCRVVVGYRQYVRRDSLDCLPDPATDAQSASEPPAEGPTSDVWGSLDGLVRQRDVIVCPDPPTQPSFPMQWEPQMAAKVVWSCLRDHIREHGPIEMDAPVQPDGEPSPPLPPYTEGMLMSACTSVVDILQPVISQLEQQAREEQHQEQGGSDEAAEHNEQGGAACDNQTDGPGK